MRTLDTKLMRDLTRMWAQAMAIALVLASGVSTLILAVGAYRSLDETRAAYYERHSFADVFANATRAPDLLEQRIQKIDGVAALETRISKPAIIDIEGFSPPVTGLVLSLPDQREPRLNRPYLRSGRGPVAGSSSEALVNEAFASAHGLRVGSTLQAILNGKKRRLTVAGIVLSPEHIYAIGPGDIVPDDRRFGVIWMSEGALDEIFDLDGAFNSVSLKLHRNASPARVIEQLDALLARYGGEGAFGRDDQLSHAFLDAELLQLRALARIIPPIFFLVSVFLINMTLSRLVALEREQIGLLKALGYTRLVIAAHYLKLALVIAAAGVVIGFALGTQFGFLITRLYAEFFHFPFLVFQRDPGVYLLSAGLSLGAAAFGAARAVHAVAALPPAVAMQPPAPPRYRRLWTERLGLDRHVTQLTMIPLRHIVRWPVRASFTALGIALSGALLIVSLFTFDSIEHMIDLTFFQTQRQDATLTLSDETDARVVEGVAQLPGVMRVEPFRSVLVRLRNGQYQKKLAIQAKPRRPALARIVDREGQTVSLPEFGLVVDERVAGILRVQPGDSVEMEVLGGWKSPERSAAPGAFPDAGRNTSRVAVIDVIQSFFGVSSYMNLEALNDILDEGALVSGLHIQYDAVRERELFAAIKSTPRIAGIGLRSVSLAKFRHTIAKNIDMMITIYAGLAIVVAFGVVYNSARVQLSEQARELASLRVLGFTKAEVSRVLMLEMAILVAVAQPFAWLFGYGFAWLTAEGFSSDVYRVPLVISVATYAWASLIVLVSAAASALVVRRRIDRLDLISVLKTRE